MADGTGQTQCQRYLQQPKGRHTGDHPVLTLSIGTLVLSPCPLTVHPGAVTLDVFHVRDVDQELPVIPEDEQGQGPLRPLNELLRVGQGHVLAGHPVDLEGQSKKASVHSLLGKLFPGKPRLLWGHSHHRIPRSFPIPAGPSPSFCFLQSHFGSGSQWPLVCLACVCKQSASIPLFYPPQIP